MDTGSGVFLTVVGAADVDDDELQELVLSLREHLLELDVEDVRLRRDQLPEDAKSAEALTLGALVVSLAPVMLRGILRCVETWMQNRPVRSVRVDVDGRTIEVAAASRDDQRRLIDAYIRALNPAEESDDAG
ncbi:hypothetical protein [Streptomyces sp. SID2888]|uniref:hypothetical protein n=1 Tax=Streptomyces TaxID=1883 RepID=UPI001F2A687C|nr:hypothetical protein [Streptomyces sp. SID2888]